MKMKPMPWFLKDCLYFDIGGICKSILINQNCFLAILLCDRTGALEFPFMLLKLFIVQLKLTVYGLSIVHVDVQL